MKNGRWQEIERLYNSTLERKPEERSAYLLEACGDESLRNEGCRSVQYDAEKTAIDR